MLSRRTASVAENHLVECISSIRLPAFVTIGAQASDTSADRQNDCRTERPD
jgi:hypothetical protein